MPNPDIVKITKTVTTEIPAADLWAAVFGSGFGTFPWWVSVEYLEGDWDVPGRVRVAVADPDDAGAVPTAHIITLSRLIDAVRIINYGGYVDACTGEDIDWQDLDACVGDLVIQVAIFGREVYA